MIKHSYLKRIEPAFLELAKYIETVPDEKGEVKRSAGTRLPDVARSIRHHVYEALPPLLEGSMASTSVSLDKNHYSLSYHANDLGFAYNIHVQRAFKKLVDAEFICITNGGYLIRPAGRSDNTKYRLTKRFKRWFEQELAKVGFSGDLYTLIVDPQLLPNGPNLRVQVKSEQQDGKRSPKTRKIAFDPSAESDEISEKVSVINRMLEKTWIDLDISDDQRDELKRRLALHKRKDRPKFIRYNERQLYRVFHDTEFSTGGRYYGGWWQTIPNSAKDGTQFRRHIVINGKPTVEVDYSALHPAILYAKQGLALPEDPYTPILGKEYRDISKRIFNALVNAKKDMKSGPRQLRYKVKGQELTWPEIKARVYEVHAPIKHFFCSGAGMWLMHEDSELATDVMHYFASSGVPCLPVHDSFLVHHGWESGLKKVMLELFEERYGVQIDMKVAPAIFQSSGRSEKTHQAETEDDLNELEQILKAVDTPQDNRLSAHRTLYQ